MLMTCVLVRREGRDEGEDAIGGGEKRLSSVGRVAKKQSRCARGG